MRCWCGGYQAMTEAWPLAMRQGDRQRPSRHRRLLPLRTQGYEQLIPGTGMFLISAFCFETVCWVCHNEPFWDLVCLQLPTYIGREIYVEMSLPMC